jgi:hypothetical protein
MRRRAGGACTPQDFAQDGHDADGRMAVLECDRSCRSVPWEGANRQTLGVFEQSIDVGLVNGQKKKKTPASRAMARMSRTVIRRTAHSHVENQGIVERLGS